MVYVAFGRHLIVDTLVLTDGDAKFDANRDKIATTKNIFLYIERTNGSIMMTSLTYAT